MRELDFRALTEPVDGAAVAAYGRQLRERRALSGTRDTMFTVVWMAFATIVASGMMSVVFVALFQELAKGWRLDLVVWLAIAAGGVVWGAIELTLGILRLTSVVPRAYRLSRFAAANGAEYVPLEKAPRKPGILLRLGGGDRRATDIVRFPGAPMIEVGNFQFAISSGRAATNRTWGYVAIRLPIRLPNILLIAKKSKVLRPDIIPAGIRRGQRLSLEGDFDKHFTLHCPTGYERDALYFFTPDIMGRLVDRAATFEIEIVDSWMLLYARDATSTTEPARWEWVTSVASSLADKVANWEAWRDDRLVMDRTPAAAVAAYSPGVASAGRRLQKASPWIAIGFSVAVFIGILAAQSLFS